MCVAASACDERDRGYSENDSGVKGGMWATQSMDHVPQKHPTRTQRLKSIVIFSETSASINMGMMFVGASLQLHKCATLDMMVVGTCMYKLSAQRLSSNTTVRFQPLIFLYDASGNMIHSLPLPTLPVPLHHRHFQNNLCQARRTQKQRHIQIARLPCYL